MGKNNKSSSLSWDDFTKLGNPDNAPNLPDEEDSGEGINYQAQIRVHYEKKGRGGKAALIIRGIEEDNDFLVDLSKKIKSKMGVGGSAKNGEIVIQGSDRKKVMEILNKEGFKQVKPAGG